MDTPVPSGSDANDKTMRAEIERRMTAALLFAREAGKLTLGYFQQPDLAVELKHDASPVTVADRQAELLLRQRITAAFQSDAILGEEFPEQPGTSGFRWILDPIDGTKSFIRGVPLYGTLVGVEHAGRSLLGVIYIPALDECVWAAVGQGAWHQQGAAPPVPARVSNCQRLSDALFCTSDAKTFAEADRQPALLNLLSGCRLMRTWGDCYGYLLVATGRADLMVDAIMSVWDAAALQPILEEAGGTFTDWRGEHTIHSGEGIGTNGRILGEVLKAIGSSK